jgi:hypothetical protein
MACLCPNCVQPMMLVRAIGRQVGLSDLHIYECKVCHVSVTQAVPAPAVVELHRKGPQARRTPSPLK